MNNSRTWEQTLRQLLENNFQIARQCRKAAEALEDVSLKYYFQNIASRRSQFAMELVEEITFYNGKEPFIPSASYDRNRKEHGQESNLSAVKKAARLNKDSLLKYQEALCKIHDGSCREILLRHKAFIENCMFELKSLKTLLKYNNKENGELKGVRSNT